MSHQERVALIIGNNDYEDQTLRQLITPGADAHALAQVLQDEAVGAFAVNRLVNAPVQTTRRHIERLFQGRKSDDLLLLYFSGHGVLDAAGRLFLAATDTEHDLLAATAIPASFVTDLMDGSRSRRQVLILDCCHSGAFARGRTAKSAEAGVGRPVGTAAAFEGNGYGRVVLTASDATQYAWEGSEVIGEGSQSVFTYHLVRGLQTGEADRNNDGLVHVDELYDYVYEHVMRSGSGQTPGKWSYRQEGDLIIARNPYATVVGPAEQTYRFSAERYGIGYAAMEIDCYIAGDGSAEVRRTVKVEAYSDVERLDTYLLIPEERPSGQQRQLAYKRVASLTPGRHVELIDQRDEAGRQSAVLTFEPPLKVGEAVTYSMGERASAGLFAIGLSQEQLARRKTYYDYFGWNINRPTRRLILRTHFPAGAAPRNFGAEVRYASGAGEPAEALNYEEQKRLARPGLSVGEDGRSILALEVDYPTIGLIYVLRWQPIEAGGDAIVR